jgi:hypothetical protein
LFGAERFSFTFRRHSFVIAFTADALYKRAGVCLSFDDCRAVVATENRALAAIEAEARLLLFRAMTLVTVTKSIFD